MDDYSAAAGPDPAGDLAFIPLGGTGEIGMNLNVYRCDGKLLAVDCGIGFGGPENPEVEVMVPDPTWLAERRDRLVGLVVTHAHEDHVGAVAHLWPQLRCPIYAGPFVSAVLRRKLGEAGLLGEARIVTIPLGGRFAAAPFDLQFLRVAHSVPEAQALAIRTRHGLVLHTGDWKLDPEPLIGEPTDEAAFAALGEEGVLAMVCDSTNALVEGHSGSEAEVRRNLAAIIRGLRGRVAVTCFATNVARVESITRAGMAAGRQVALFGRSLRNAEAAARECGYLTDIPPYVPEEEAGYIPDDNLLIICTGSQGEPRSALAKIAADTHQQIALGEGDTVIFSSRMIPGNERGILQMQDLLARRGCRVMTADDHMVHVSGHPARDELKRLYQLVKPKYAVPVHGEWRHLTEHAALARALQTTPVLVEDGDVLQLAPGRPEVVEGVPTGRLAVDNGRLLPLSGGVLAARKRMLFNGVVMASLAVDGAGRVQGTPQVSAPGLLDGDEPLGPQLAAELARAVMDLPSALRREDDALREAARGMLRKAVGRRLRKRPSVEVHLLRV
ncbi:ribonuclease J [Paracraurococcus ruber]|uniref:MBL fold metallo-hydrolase n=2 Tax=Paracraurococcus ruber TaxID=77675 RepID=A0ABS1CQU6_9PROT|nr:ribonuclease J [Paracraurococcus ruber]MBK1656720.1 MBL fold metallo-hydrolase [Paracraurococcus ruber]TDG31991.1 ribonuclease J [Paracraurococcus ruber]